MTKTSQLRTSFTRLRYLQPRRIGFAMCLKLWLEISSARALSRLSMTMRWPRDRPQPDRMPKFGCMGAISLALATLK